MERTGLEGFWYWLATGVVVVSIALFGVKAVSMMLIQSAYYKNLARDNRLNRTIIMAPRGTIFDRNDRIVAQSVYHYFRMQDGVKVYEGGEGFVGEKFEKRGFLYDLKRKYNYNEAMSHVSGYVGKQGDNYDIVCPTESDKNALVGKMGVEAEFECDLRGEDGERLVEVDARGQFVRDMGRKDPVSGKDLHLSIDAYWQQKAYDLLAGKRAALVAIEPNTGKVIVMASSPAYNPNDFSYVVDNQKINDYLKNTSEKPLLNRAIAARYHPGSVFKISVATAGLETGVINSNTLIEDTGFIKVGDYMYRNWLWTKNGTTDGMVDVVKGLQRSNDIFFYQLGDRLGPDNIKLWAGKFGFGKESGVELPGEIPGILPDPKWKKDKKNENWFLGNTYHYAIGQGDLDVTPLQVAVMTQTIANNGVRCNPSILKQGDGLCESLGINQKTLELVQEGMKRACKSGGTAWPLFNFKTELACKTGTAEVGDGSRDTHAWLTAFAPVSNPQIVVTVMVERGGEGSDVAGPIMGDFLKEYLGEPDTVVPRKTVTEKVVGE